MGLCIANARGTHGNKYLQSTRKDVQNDRDNQNIKQTGQCLQGQKACQNYLQQQKANIQQNAYISNGIIDQEGEAVGRKQDIKQSQEFEQQDQLGQQTPRKNKVCNQYFDTKSLRENIQHKLQKQSRALRDDVNPIFQQKSICQNDQQQNSLQISKQSNQFGQNQVDKQGDINAKPIYSNSSQQNQNINNNQVEKQHQNIIIKNKLQASNQNSQQRKDFSVLKNIDSNLNNQFEHKAKPFSVLNYVNIKNPVLLRNNVEKQYQNKISRQLPEIQEEQFYQNQNKGYTQKDTSLISATNKFQHPIRLQKVYLKNGTQYEGCWLQGKKFGKGIQINSDGSKYQGQWKNNKENGIGVLTYENGQIFQGQFVNGKAHGFGKRKFYIKNTSNKVNNYDKISVEYEGYWKDDLQHGMGTQKWSNGCFYQGSFRNGFKQGQGFMIFEDKSQYRGQFKNNLMHGKGIYIWKSQNKLSQLKKTEQVQLSTNQFEVFQKIYKGQFNQGKFHGKGRLQIKMAKKGKILANYVQESAIFFNIYEGQFSNDCMHGNGVLKYYDGSQYRGQFQNDLRHGKGQFSDINNNKTKGIFKNGMLAMKIVTGKDPSLSISSIKGINEISLVR